MPTVAARVHDGGRPQLQRLHGLVQSGPGGAVADAEQHLVVEAVEQGGAPEQLGAVGARRGSRSGAPSSTKPTHGVTGGQGHVGHLATVSAGADDDEAHGGHAPVERRHRGLALAADALARSTHRRQGAPEDAEVERAGVRVST